MENVRMVGEILYEKFLLTPLTYIYIPTVLG